MSEPATATADARRVATGRFSPWVRTLGIFGVALLLVLLGAGLQGGHAIRGFLTARNFLNIVDAVSLLGIVAGGMAFVTYSGHYADLSAPTTMALTGIVAVETLRFGFWPAMAAAVVVGLAIGGLNALLVGRLRRGPAPPARRQPPRASGARCPHRRALRPGFAPYGEGRRWP